MDEAYLIEIEVTNTDDRALDVVADVLLQPTEVDEAGTFSSSPIAILSLRFALLVQFIAFDGQISSGLIKGVLFGTVNPGVSVVKTLTLMSSGAPGDRTIDVSVQSSTTLRSAAASPSPSQPQARSTSLSETLDVPQNLDTAEILRTLLIPTLNTFTVRQDVIYQRSLQPPPALADLSVLEKPHSETHSDGEAVVTTVVECSAPCGVEVENVVLRRVVRASLMEISYQKLIKWCRRVGTRGWWIRH